MVKRTVVVLGIFVLILSVAADSSMAFGRKCFGKEFMCPAKPLYLPVDVPDCVQRTIVSTWEVNIEGPCPPVSPPACVGGRGLLGRGDGPGFLLSAVTIFGAPFDILMAGRGSVNRCRGLGEGPCGNGFPGPLGRMMYSLTFPVTGNFFGGLW